MNGILKAASSTDIVILLLKEILEVNKTVKLVVHVA